MNVLLHHATFVLHHLAFILHHFATFKLLSLLYCLVIHHEFPHICHILCFIAIAIDDRLKGIIAGKRKAARGNGREEADSSQEDKEVMTSSPAPDNQFDGGFFQITSPARTSSKQSPKTPVSGEKGRRSMGGDHLRRQNLNDSTRISVSGLIMFPF